MQQAAVVLALVVGAAALGCGSGHQSRDSGQPAPAIDATINPVYLTGIGSGDCTFTLSYSLSPKISTVGIVTWSATLPAPTEAHIDFGLDAGYGMTAPVDLSQPTYRTLLLGMKPAKTYHFQISATGAAGSCASGDLTIETGPLPNGFPYPTITTTNAGALSGGFLVTGQYVRIAGKGAPAFILDRDGDVVWWYAVSDTDATGVTMSYDGNYLWVNGVDVPKSAAHVHRISMDGLIDEDHSAEFAGLSHQLTVLPDETVAFYAYGSNGCDDIKLRAPNGNVWTVVNAREAHSGSGACHVNAIFYSKMDDTLVFSDLDNNCLTKVTRAGGTVWVLNGGGSSGPTSWFNDDAVLWKDGQHGFHILSLDDFVIFNNNSQAPAGGSASWTAEAKGDGISGSRAIEVKLDLSNMTATQTWSFQGGSTLNDQVLGDVQRLPNGNTIVDFATKGMIEEVDPDGNVLQQIQMTQNFGYMQKRTTLYGPPPR